MASEPIDMLPGEAQLALAWSGRKLRAPLATALQLDRRLARIVGRTHETMLGQMRLAWWREALAKPLADRPRGDAVLDAIGLHWHGREAALVEMVDAWEVLVTAQTITGKEAAAFGSGRGAFFATLAEGRDKAARCAAAGTRWALADAAAAISDPAERAVVVAAGLGVPDAPGVLGGDLRGLAVLESLALRAMKRGGRPLMEGRGAPLAVLRGAILGR